MQELSYDERLPFDQMPALRFRGSSGPQMAEKEGSGDDEIERKPKRQYNEYRDRRPEETSQDHGDGNIPGKDYQPDPEVPLVRLSDRPIPVRHRQGIGILHLCKDKGGMIMGRMILVSFTAALVVVFAAGISFAKGPGTGRTRGPGKDTGSAVSQAVHKAQAESLKGRDIAEAAHKAIGERKEGRQEDIAGGGEEMSGKDRAAHKHNRDRGHSKHGGGPTAVKSR